MALRRHAALLEAGPTRVHRERRRQRRGPDGHARPRAAAGMHRHTHRPQRTECAGASDGATHRGLDGARARGARTMSVPSRLLPRPEPPHDPYSHLLAGSIGADPRKGFRIARTRDVEVAAPANVLTLGPTPDVARLLTEPSGSFGGLRPPTNVAVGPGGDIYLL